jgi:hypothetical protein
MWILIKTAGPLWKWRKSALADASLSLRLLDKVFEQGEKNMTRLLPL